jgi:hypothetical protein
MVVDGDCVARISYTIGDRSSTQNVSKSTTTVTLLTGKCKNKKVASYFAYTTIYVNKKTVTNAAVEVDVSQYTRQPRKIHSLNKSHNIVTSRVKVNQIIVVYF